MREFIVINSQHRSSGKQSLHGPILFQGDNDADFSCIVTLINRKTKQSVPILDDRKYGKWGIPIDELGESSLLATIQENSQLPEKAQHRYQELWTKCENETITDVELVEYQTLISKLDTRNLIRIEALIALAKSRGKPFQEILTEIELHEPGDAV